MINKKSLENRELAKDGLKRCSTCQEIKSISEFNKKKITWDGLRSNCKNCDRLSHDIYRSNPKNIKREIESKRRYRQSESGKAVHSAYGKVWSARNKERKKKLRSDWHIANKESENAISRERMKQWVKDNPDRHRTNQRRYRATEYRAEGLHTQEQWEMLQCFYNGYCPRCNQESKLSLDHIVPLVQGGTHYIDNIQGLCKSCNSAKGDRVIIDYRPKEARYWAWVEMAFVALY